MRDRHRASFRGHVRRRLAGRIGLWQTGNFNRWLGRVTTDQANFDRMHEWGAQQVVTHHLRNLVCSASLGADIFYNTLEIADLGFEKGQDTSPQYGQLALFTKCWKKGCFIFHAVRNYYPSRICFSA